MYVRIRKEDKSALQMPGLDDYDLVQLRGEFYQYETTLAAKSMLRLIHDVTYGPPEKCYIHSVSDIPALLHRSTGKGSVALLPFQIGAMYREWGNPGHPMLAVGTLDNLLKTDRRLRVDTSALVEVTHRQDPGGKFEWVALYNHSGRLENSFHAPIPIHDIRIRLKANKAVRTIKSMKSGETLEFTQNDDGQIDVTLPKLDCFDGVLFVYEP